VPYHIEDLIAVIDDRMGKLENRSRVTTYNKLLQRITTFRNHARYHFMFENATVSGDTMAEVVGHLFRIPANGKPMTIMQLAGFPAEVVDSVVSVLSRMAFDFGLWSDGASPPAVRLRRAAPLRSGRQQDRLRPDSARAVADRQRGAQVRRLPRPVTQPPAENDPNIISQCSTMFVIRLSNDRDQALIRSAISDAGASMLTFFPSLGTGEVFAFGAGVPLPTRMKFRVVPLEKRPASEAGSTTRLAPGAAADRGMIDSVIDHWRASTMSRGQIDDERSELGSWRDDIAAMRDDVPRYTAAPPLAPTVAAPPPPPPPPVPEPPPQRPSILRRPLSTEPLGPNNPTPLPSRYRT
jgi:DNA helicase HerA-like ATPase